MSPPVEHPHLRLPPGEQGQGDLDAPPTTVTQPLVAGAAAAAQPGPGQPTGTNNGRPPRRTATQTTPSVTQNEAPGQANPNGAAGPATTTQAAGQNANTAQRTTRGSNSASTGANRAPGATTDSAMLLDILRTLNNRMSVLESALQGQPGRQAAGTPAATSAPAVAVEEDDSVPNPVPGFLSNAADIAVPASIVAAIKQNKSFCYNALTMSARLAARTRGGEMVLHEDGTVGPKDVSRGTDANISLADWGNSARIVLAVARKECKAERVEALERHHANVHSLAASHGWVAAREYDITTRELSVLDPRHDIAKLNWDIINSSATRSLLKRAATDVPVPAVAAATPAASHPYKKPRTANTPPSTGGHCFRCGQRGHYTKDCTASVTVAGLPVAAVSPNNRGGVTLIAADKLPYCFTFTKQSACQYDGSCRHKHACSICHKSIHGAAQCDRVSAI
ncbi:hypothetical protein PsYK624_112450 [Phanerochaete sordida]|uniref:CCHC-type domain-containing protein n=1 Tax=Phanerochaete sordida TaxID=48140 RepID=A0A9P3LH09_9APHY|nr:hypothetical protein PsYK624_112450 [Phanerochaete sordida]